MFSKRRLFGLGAQKQAPRDLGRNHRAGAEEDAEATLRVTGGITSFTNEVVVTVCDVFNGEDFDHHVYFHTLDGIPIAHYDPNVSGEERIVTIMVAESIARDLEVGD